MTWIIVGLVIATAVSIEGTLSGERGRGVKLLLIGLAVAGAVVAGISAYQDNASRELDKANLDSANKQLEAQKPILDLLNVTVGDLGTLNRLSAGEKYYVRISAGSRDTMEKYRKAIERRFKVAQSNSLLSVRPLRPNCPPDDPQVNCWGLVFGSNLNLAAAEVFARFANESGFPPEKQHAELEPESRN
jgi:hypothetical protein